MTWYLVIFGVAGIGLAAGLVSLIIRRRRRPRTRAEKLAAARKVTRSLRRSALRPDRDTFERGGDLPDRYSAGIVENAAYGDASHFHSGDSGY